MKVLEHERGLLKMIENVRGKRKMKGSVRERNTQDVGENALKKVDR